MSFEPMKSPPGIARWPKLQTPQPSKWGKRAYSLELQLDLLKDEDLAFVDVLKRLHAQAVAEERARTAAAVEPAPLPLCEDPLDGLRIRFKLPVMRNDPAAAPILLDASGRPLDVRVEDGSVVRVFFTPRPYYLPEERQAGITLRFEVVQYLAPPASPMLDHGGHAAATPSVERYRHLIS